MKVTISAGSEEGKECALLGCIYWGDLKINDSFVVDVPPNGTGFSKYYNLRTKARGAFAFFSNALIKDGKGTYLKDAPNVTIKVEG
ncbi:MAG: hypothetical protein HY957_03115 [Nitrospirae bacterium]|nr:hypothetical protein [Nitrospirota bacterium]